MAAKEKVVLDFDPILEEEETKCSDDLWNYIEAHEDELGIWKIMPKDAGSNRSVLQINISCNGN
jgi:hypothetical protein